ncbi:hypothetical protein KIH07_16760 [Hydrogenophaga taeniospiralis]|uniref:hypothetical protein n=1 Tax=Hydrogenophaga taeniospiralis TaxID=65656 RepID=UPI001CFC0059|nr:hypothetical protein [Hydrogenophaga taeniospiralis]MCB4365396.1 hypothetical protein [Hydrogenophaga taeniospiralis]
MSTTLQIVHALSTLVVLAEALNKLERAQPLACGLSPRERLVDALKAAAWLLLALGAAGSLAAPVLLALGLPAGDAVGMLARLERPTLAEVLVLSGFATLIVRTRVKEG